MVKMIINAGANVNKLATFDTHSNVTPLHLASQDGHTNVVRELIKAKADLDVGKNTKERHGITALAQAVFNGHTDTGLVLVDAGANANVQGSNGYTALHYAAQQGNLKMAESLINHQADVHLKASFNDHAEVTALHLTAQNGHHEMVRLLVKAGADINAGKSMGQVKGITPLHQAVSNKHIGAVQALIELGADINARATGTNNS